MVLAVRAGVLKIPAIYAVGKETAHCGTSYLVRRLHMKWSRFLPVVGCLFLAAQSISGAVKEPTTLADFCQ